MAAMLEVKNLNVYYGKAQAVTDVSFDVSEGEVVTVIGPNGAGKSTIMKAIAGLLRPTSGEIRFKDKRIDGKPTYDIVGAGLTLVPEGRKLFPTLTVRENLIMGSYTRRAKAKRSETLKEVYSIFPRLEERKDQLSSNLSGGEAQMLAIARGLMALPSLLLVDEPSVGLAPMVVRDVFETLKKLGERGTTLLIVEQHIEHVLRMAGRGYLLENGQIVLKGTGRELLNDKHVKTHYLGM